MMIFPNNDDFSKKNSLKKFAKDLKKIFKKIEKNI